MYEPHSVLHFPDDDNAVIWRYIDITKLIAMLDSKAICFTRADSLGDPFEGAYPRAAFSFFGEDIWEQLPSRMRDASRDDKWINTLDQWLRRHKNDYDKLTYIKGLEKDPVAVLIHSLKNIKYFRTTMFMNCWHMNEVESDAMWKLYLKSDEGIAIKSTAGRLRDSFAGCGERIFISQVKYINYETDEFNTTNAFEYVIHKRSSFEHEKELRAIFSSMMGGSSHQVGDDDTGVQIGCDLRKLVEEIRIAPTSPPWITDVVHSLVKQYGFEFPVEQSRLRALPVW